MYPRTHTHTQWHTLNDTALTHRHTFIDTPTPTFIFTFIPLSHTTTPAVSMVITMFLMLILSIISLFYFNVVLYLSLYCRLMKLVGAKISKIKSCLQKGTLVFFPILYCIVCHWVVMYIIVLKCMPLYCNVCHCIALYIIVLY